MASTELIGWVAATMTLLAFTARDVRLLRLASLGASLAFVTYGAATATWPVLALHCVLLPINLLRLRELRRLSLCVTTHDRAGGASVPSACQTRLEKAATRGWPLRRLAMLTLATLVVLPGTLPAAAAPPTHAERMHARALESFRQGRFPEAYGRFIDLANAGHPASARYALWMCEQGLALFGKDWDCTPDEVADWSRASRSLQFTTAALSARCAAGGRPTSPGCQARP